MSPHKRQVRQADGASLQSNGPTFLSRLQQHSKGGPLLLLLASQTPENSVDLTKRGKNNSTTKIPGQNITFDPRFIQVINACVCILSFWTIFSWGKNILTNTKKLHEEKRSRNVSELSESCRFYVGQCSVKHERQQPSQVPLFSFFRPDKYALHGIIVFDRVRKQWKTVNGKNKPLTWKCLTFFAVRLLCKRYHELL